MFFMHRCFWYICYMKNKNFYNEAGEHSREVEYLREALNAKAASKSAFLANISHEMRTPLNAIIGLSSLMLEGKEITEGYRENLELINGSGLMLLSVINDILDINKIEAEKFEIFPVEYELPLLINDISSLYAEYAIDGPVRFTLKIDETLPFKLFGDKARIKQICNKLLDNAFKFTSYGDIKLSVSCERYENNVLLLIKVRDSGIGIHNEDIERIFSEYGQLDTTAHRRAGGSGLGLNIARRIAELMGGNLSVVSEKSKGSVFTLCLRQKIASERQIGHELAARLKNFNYSGESYSGENRGHYYHLNRVHIPDAKVLVVDDVRTNLKVAEGLLKSYGMEVECAQSGQEAIEKIRCVEVPFNIIFMDYMMPDMDGIETTRIIRKEIDTMYAKTVPIIALTAVDFDGREDLFLQNGFNAILAKPIDIIRLDREINRWVLGVA